jgi:hypothetical protein
MMQADPSISVAWGLDSSGTTPRLVRVSRTSDGLKFDLEPPEAPPGTNPGATPGAPVFDSADEQQPAAAEPLVACLGDELVLHRILDLPTADDAAMAQMLAAQLEVMLPARSQLFAWDWDPRSLDGSTNRSTPGGGGVWLSAARKDAVEDALRHARTAAGRDAAGVVPTSMALAAAVPALLSAMPKQLLVVDAAEHTASVLIFYDGVLLDCAVLDPGPDQWTAQLREVYQALVHDLPTAQRPSACVLLERRAPSPGLEQAIATLLGLDLVPARLNADVTIADLPAIGAALTKVQPVCPNILLSPYDSQAEGQAVGDKDDKAIGQKPFARGRVLVAVWLLLAVAGLYIADVYEAHRLEAIVQRIESAIVDRGGFDRQLAIGYYLERAGPAGLDVLAEVSAISEQQILYAEWHYTHGGGVKLTGVAPNAPALLKLLDALAKAKTLSNVEIKSRKAEKNKSHFVIAADLSKTYLPPSHKQKTAEAKPPEKDKDKAPDKDKPKDKGKAADKAKPQGNRIFLKPQIPMFAIC